MTLLFTSDLEQRVVVQAIAASLLTGSSDAERGTAFLAAYSACLPIEVMDEHSESELHNHHRALAWMHELDYISPESKP